MAQLLSLIGDQFAIEALTWLVFDRSDSPLLAAITYAISFLPWLIGGPLLPSGSSTVRTSVSIGIAELWSPLQGVTDRLAAADLSLYRAKETRDQVHPASRDDHPSRRHL